MTAGEDELRDAHLLAALRHAPDNEALPDPRVSAAIFDQARRALAAAEPRPARGKPGWRAVWNRWLQRGWQPAPMAAFGSLAMAAVIGLLWHGQDLPDATPSLRPAPGTVARPAEHDVRTRDVAAEQSPAAAPTPTPTPSPSPPSSTPRPPQPRQEALSGLAKSATPLTRSAAERPAVPARQAPPGNAPAVLPAAPPSTRVEASAERPEPVARELADSVESAPREAAIPARGDSARAEARARAAAPTAPTAPTASTAPSARAELAAPSAPVALAGASSAAAPLAPTAAAVEAATARGGSSVVWRVAPQRDVDHGAAQRIWWAELSAATEGRWRPASAATSKPADRGAIELWLDGRAQGQLVFEAQALVWRDAAGASYRAALPEPMLRALRESAARW